ncbi:MAG: energy transducer TonB [Gammaproteobacteria bacterium]|nr:energy transducer TonB [Gammaproteobacteria bacterium]
MSISKRTFALGTLTSALLASSTFVNADTLPELVSTKALTAIATELPAYPRFADAMFVEGYAVLQFTVAPDGSVVEPTVRDFSSNEFTEAALEAVESWKFEPVYQDGVAVPVRTAVKFSFVPRTE